MEDDVIKINIDTIENLEDELEKMYSKMSHLLCDLTDGKLSYPTYDLETMKEEIIKAQEKNNNEYIREDIKSIIEDGGDYGDIIKYLDDLI